MVRKYEEDSKPVCFTGLNPVTSPVLGFHPSVTDSSQSQSRPSRSIMGPVFLLRANSVGIQTFICKIH